MISGALIALDDVVEDEGMLDQWDQLAGRAVGNNPFAEAAFVVAAHRHLGGARELGVLVARDAHRWYAAVPVRRFPRGGRLPFPLLTTRLNEYSFLGTPLVDPADPLAAWRAVADTLGRGGVPRFLKLELVGADEDVRRMLEDAVPRRRRVEFPLVSRAAVRARSGDPVSEQISGRHRREMARRLRALTAEVGDVGPVEIGGDAETVERFLMVEASGWKGVSGTALARRPGGAEFFRAWCRALDGDGRMRFLVLGAPEAPAASVCIVWSGDVGFSFKLGVDESLARHSPGTQLMADVARHYAGRPGGCCLDSCADPENEMINRLWPDRRELVTVVVGASGLGARLALGASSMAIAAGRP